MTYKTILETAANFDAEFNTAISEGWYLVTMLQPVYNGTDVLIGALMIKPL